MPAKSSPKSKRPMSRGLCLLCGTEYSKNTISRHLDKCQMDTAAREKHDPGTLQPTQFFRILVEAFDLPDYWLHLEMRADATLADLDDYLRGVWLECCGHLSAFTIDRTRYRWQPPGGFDDDDNDFFDGMDSAFGIPPERRMDVTLAAVLPPGTAATYEYDFGSATELKLRVLSAHEEPTRGHNLRLLSRNEPPQIACKECGEEAAWIGPYDDTYEIKAICDACIEKKDLDDADLLPVVNSPRTGVCAYSGPI